MYVIIKVTYSYHQPPLLLQVRMLSWSPHTHPPSSGGMLQRDVDIMGRLGWPTFPWTLKNSFLIPEFEPSVSSALIKYIPTELHPASEKWAHSLLLAAISRPHTSTGFEVRLCSYRLSNNIITWILVSKLCFPVETGVLHLALKQWHLRFHWSRREGGPIDTMLCCLVIITVIGIFLWTNKFRHHLGSI